MPSSTSNLARRARSDATRPERARSAGGAPLQGAHCAEPGLSARDNTNDARSEEHTSELQSQSNLVCRLLLEKKKKYMKLTHSHSCTKNRQPNCVRQRSSYL